MQIKALVFDMDDTLYPERAYVQSGFRAVDEWLRRTEGIAGFYDKAEALFEAGLRGNVFDAALSVLGVGHAPGRIEAMVAAYRFHEPDIELSEDAVRMFARLDPSVRTGLISDGYLVPQSKKAAALGLADRLDAILLTDALGRECWKPSPVPYERMSRMLGHPPAACAYVGDHPAKDFIAAKRLGWTTVRIVRPGGLHASVTAAAPEAEAHHRIQDLEELERVPALAALFRRPGIRSGTEGVVQ